MKNEISEDCDGLEEKQCIFKETLILKNKKQK
jgi:hypothetical protein